MTDRRPTAAELVAAVAEFLETEVSGALDGAAAFQAKVAVNALRIVERELAAAPPVDTRGVAQGIRDGQLAIDDPDVLDQLRIDVLARLAVDNPAYPSLREARTRWERD